MRINTRIGVRIVELIRLATQEDRLAVNRLRTSEYKLSTEFDLLHSEPLFWVESERGIVLGAWASNTLAATMQANVTCDRNEAEELLGCGISAPGVAFPALVLTRAATAHKYRRTSLNAALRFYFVSAAMGHVGSVIGGVFAGAPRLKVMAEIGYTFHETESCPEMMNPKTKRFLAVLPACQMRFAVSRLQGLAAIALGEYRWSGPSLVLR